MRKTAMISLVILVSLFFFGCTGSAGTGDQSGTSDADRAMAAAYADKANLYAVKFIYGEDDIPFSGTISFINDDGSKKQYHISGGGVINRDEICSGSGPGTTLYRSVGVTFDDSPVGETWEWKDYGYCDRYYFYPTVSEESMRAVAYPVDPTYRKAAAMSFLNPDKAVIVFTIGGWGNVSFDGTATFFSPGGSETFSAQTSSGALMVDRDELCDASGRDRYRNMNVTFKDSPVGETWKWDTDYCTEGPHIAWLTEEQIAAIKDPRFSISLFEYPDFGGSPVNATVYCGNVSLGPLVDGYLNISKATVLDAVGPINCSISFVGNFTVFERPYHFNFCGWTLMRSYADTYSQWDTYLDTTFEEYLRTAPCDTAMSFITPNDTMVQYRMQRYMRVKTADTYLDLDSIIHYMAKDFGYTSDESQFPTGDWWQLPTEFMSVKSANKGDCEDWAVSFLSLAYAREPTRCWAMYVGFIYPNQTIDEGHVSVFCDVNGVHKIYDQVGTIMEPDLWNRYFIWFDGDHKFRDKGVVRIRPYSVFNNTFYSQVDDVAGMYRVLGISG